MARAKKNAAAPKIDIGMEVFAALRELEKTKGIPVEYMVERMKQGMANAYRKDREDRRDVPADNVVVDLSEKGLFVHVTKTVVEIVEDTALEIHIDAAKNYNPDAQLGDIVSIPVDVDKFSRIAAQTFKQVLIQGIREAERGMVYESYADKAQELLTATVLRIDPNGNVFVRIGQGNEVSDAVLRTSEQIPGETYTEVVGEVTEHGEQLVLLKGGRGGLGNWHFRTATNQAPRYSQPGEEGAEGAFILELKVLADVGLVGFPNAGKSTLLSVVSAAKPKIANYAFTTLEPNLGIVEVRDGHSFVMADIPGIIEGAHEGKGLGTRFLRHIERNSILLFMIPADSDDIRKDFDILLGELTQYNPELLDKTRILAITKCDMLDDELMEEMKSHLPDGVKSLFISSVAGLNIAKLKDMLWAALHE